MNTQSSLIEEHSVETIAEPFIVAVTGWDHRERPGKYYAAMEKVVAKHKLTYELVDNFGGDGTSIIGANQPFTDEEAEMFLFIYDSQNGKHMGKGLVEVVAFASKEAALAECKEAMEY